MKSLKDVYKYVYDYDNLYQAHLKARRGKRNKNEIINFENLLNCNLSQLQSELINKTYKISGYNVFKIHEPKERLIMALPYRDRVVQHSLCGNILESFINKMLIYDNCASQVGKGTHFGLNRVSCFLRDYYNKRGTEGWILKGDIKNYFYSVDHVVLKRLLYKKIKDKDLIWLLDTIIDSHDGRKGLPIGNLTSQFFGIFYLDPLDRLIKEEMRIKHYSRYQDDIFLIFEDRNKAKECLSYIKSYVNNVLKLQINEKSQIFPMKNGVDYLGFHTYLTDTGKIIRKLRRSSKQKMKRKVKFFIKKYSTGEIPIENIRMSLASWSGHISHGHTYKLKKSIYVKLILKRHR